MWEKEYTESGHVGNRLPAYQAKPLHEERINVIIIGQVIDNIRQNDDIID